MHLRIIPLASLLIALGAGYVLACNHKKHTVSEVAFEGDGNFVPCGAGYCPENGTETRVFDCSSTGGSGKNCLIDSFAWTSRFKVYACELGQCVAHYDNAAWGGKLTIDCPP